MEIWQSKNEILSPVSHSLGHTPLNRPIMLDTASCERKSIWSIPEAERWPLTETSSRGPAGGRCDQLPLTRGRCTAAAVHYLR